VGKGNPLGNTCTYDATLGLKTSSSFWVQNTSTPTAFTLSRTETYGYDQYLDYLTSANYNDGLNNSSPTWSYDAAGSGTGSSPLDLDYLRQVQIARSALIPKARHGRNAEIPNCTDPQVGDVTTPAASDA
jgi:hypothetical protein